MDGSYILSIVGIFISIRGLLISKKIYNKQLKQEIKPLYINIINNDLLNLEKTRHIYFKLINSDSIEDYDKTAYRIIELLNDIDLVIQKQRDIIKFEHPIIYYLFVKTYSIENLLIKAGICTWKDLYYNNTANGIICIDGIRNHKNIYKNCTINYFYKFFWYTNEEYRVTYSDTLRHIVSMNMKIINNKDYKENYYDTLIRDILTYQYQLAGLDCLKIADYDRYTVSKIAKYRYRDNSNSFKAESFIYYIQDKNNNKPLKNKKIHIIHNIFLLSYIYIHDFILAKTWDIVKYLDDKKQKG